MKVCNTCGIEIDTKDGENRCQQCEEQAASGKRSTKVKRHRREIDSVMRDLGLVKVRGAMGGTYWE